MISTAEFSLALRNGGVREIVGVPDSLLKSLLRQLEADFGDSFRVLANEGLAVAHAVGAYAAIGSPALVFMQNSGLGNALNPLVSLADPSVFGCPMILLIGWRGEVNSTGVQSEDEPQHMLQGQITEEILRLAQIPFFEVSSTSRIQPEIQIAISSATKRNGPVALLVRKDSFVPISREDTADSKESLLTREGAISGVIRSLPPEVPIVAATGMIGREVQELRKASEGYRGQDLLVVGGMGHCSTIAAAVAALSSFQKVLCLDGDGGVLMHLGALPSISNRVALIHVMLNNGVHDSVGGQSTGAHKINFRKISLGANYGSYFRCQTVNQIEKAINACLESDQSSFIEIHCKPGHRKLLTRPTMPPSQNFARFSAMIRSGPTQHGR